MRASLRVLVLLYLCFLVHEGGHALMFWLCGYPIKSFILGIGPALSFNALDIEWGIAPLPLGAYVRSSNEAPQWVEVLSTLAGPAASIGVLALHPNGIARLSRLTYQFYRNGGWFVVKQIPRVWLVLLLRDASDRLDAEKNKPEPADPGFFARVPVLDTLILWRGWSFWKMTFALGLVNLVPIPPMDGARTLLHLIPETPTGNGVYVIATILSLVFFLVLVPLWSMGKYVYTKVQARLRPA